MRRDGQLCATASLFFALAQAITGVAAPLFGLKAGYSAAELGLYIALSGLVQLLARLWLVPAMHRWPDRVILIIAVVAMGLASLLLLFPAIIYFFVLAQILLGFSRAWFWAGLQSHAVRLGTDQVGAIARLNLVSSVGMVVGPIIGGSLADRAPYWAMGVALISVMLLTATILQLKSLAVIVVVERESKPVWRGKDVIIGSAAYASSGAWHSLLGSFVPIVLAAAGHSPHTIGLLVGIGNLAIMAGSGLLMKWFKEGTGILIGTTMLVSAIGMGALGAVAASTWMSVTALVVSGTAAGVLHTLGPGVASRSVVQDERPGAIVAVGTARAVAMFAVPLGMSGLMLVPGVNLAVAMGIMGCLMMTPVPVVRRAGR